MNKNDILKNILKPTRYTLMGKATLVETKSGNYVIKDCPNNDLVNLFNYLKSRSFPNIPNIYSQDRDNIIYEYIENNGVINPQKDLDLINLVALLHAKTSYNKTVSKDVYQEIYENILNNIMYLKDHYLTYYESFLHEEFMRPSHYLLVRNYSKIKNALAFCENELNNWYDLVMNNDTVRLSLIHNNLRLDHFIKSDIDYLVSWDNAKFDTPIIDLFTLYQNEYQNLEFATMYKNYLQINNLSETEQKLFFVLISLVPKIEFEGDEFTNCQIIHQKLTLIYKTENFLKPYYATDTNTE